MAFAFAVAGIVVYFLALMCTHLAAFRTASNIRKAGMAHLMKTPLGFFDSNASGLLRNRLDGAAGETETLLAHNLADIIGTAAMFLSTVILMFVFDWRMGAACLIAAVVSVIALFTMMGGKNAKLMADADNESHIQAAISELVKGKTLLVIAHRLNTVQNADQILVVEDGHIAERGTHKELMASEGLYHSMVTKRSEIRGFAH